MPQKQCPWCGRCGERYRDGETTGPEHAPHADGSSCVCRHVNTSSRLSALDHGGRYYCRERGRWVCPWCGTDTPGTAEEWAVVEVSRREDCSYADAAALVTSSDVAEARRAYEAASA